jgi:ceramide glucosyltransferase
VTVLKPVHGLEKDLRENLRSACIQDYPDYQVVLSVQRQDDAAIPLLREIQQEFGAERVTVAVENRRVGANGKINNLVGGLAHARHDILVISDSDISLRPDYLKTIVAPLADDDVGFVCTLYKAVGACEWYEKIELLSFNADLMPNIVFAHVTGAAKFCLGASTAVRRSDLEKFGGLEVLGDYLVEDFEMGRRIWESGKRPVVLPYLVDTTVDLRTLPEWWRHQVYWDQNNRAARPGGYFATVLLRSVPFALLYAVSQTDYGLGLGVLGASIALRLSTAAVILRWGLHDREGLRSLGLLVLRDILALVSFLLAYTKRRTVWRGAEFTLTRDGRIVERRTGA